MKTLGSKLWSSKNFGGTNYKEMGNHGTEITNYTNNRLLQTGKLSFTISSFFTDKTTSQKFNSDHSQKSKYNKHMLSCTPIPDKTRIHTRAKIRSRGKRNRKGAKPAYWSFLKVLISVLTILDWPNVNKTEINSFFKLNFRSGISSNR